MQIYLKTLHDQCIDLADTLNFDGALERDGFLVCLYGRIVELASAIIHVIDGEHSYVSGILFRSTLETYADFLNLTNDRQYFHRIVATNHNKWIGVIANSKAPNPYLSKIAAEQNLDQRLANHTERLRQLKDAGHAPLKPRDKFLLADLEDEYRSIYKFSSGEAHSDFDAVQARHLKNVDGQLKIEFYRDKQNDEHLALQMHLSDIVLDCTLKIHRALNGANEDLLNELERAHEAKQAEYADHP